MLEYLLFLVSLFCFAAFIYLFLLFFIYLLIFFLWSGILSQVGNNYSDCGQNMWILW